MPGKGQVELVSVHKNYGNRPAVMDVNLRIPSGAYVCLLGPSGCGKSTTLRMLAGHESVSEGDILMDNRNVTDFSPTQRGTAMMFQSYALFPHMNCLDNVAFGLRIAGMKKSERQDRARELLALVNMQDFAESFPEQLSGGQQQRVALARALITEPDVVLLDEPLSALDPFLRIKMRKELKAIQQKLGLTFVHVTHSQEEAFALADIAVVMEGGKIRQIAPPRTLFERPATPFVAQFIGGHNLLQGRLGQSQAGRIRLELDDNTGGWITDNQVSSDIQPGDALSFSVRCDHLALALPGDALEHEFSLPATIRDIEFQGAFLYVECTTASGESLMAYLPERDCGQWPLQCGDAVVLGWKAEHINLFQQHLA
ncbi:ABC transporter ATP-binding protein [Pokkaliibacter sp. CJK22405]|uniref:ABC transporter ATP-binding protein n=1 Tax=Pokkaliibacter sp. CJK22405 TaxID=3384615 RepID=UPI00398551BC